MGLKILPRPCAGFFFVQNKSIPPKGCLFYFRFRIFSRKIKPFIFPVISVLFPMKHFSFPLPSHPSDIQKCPDNLISIPFPGNFFLLSFSRPDSFPYAEKIHTPSRGCALRSFSPAFAPAEAVIKGSPRQNFSYKTPFRESEPMIFSDFIGIFLHCFT